MSTHTVNIQNSLTFANLLAQKILKIMQDYWDPTWKFQSGFPSGVWSATWKWFETRGPQMPNALIEYAFHTNPYEEECIITGTYQGRELPCRKREPWRSLMAQATYKAVCDYFGVPYELPSKVTDLKAFPGCNPGEIILTWTAPGEDGDYVKVASYTVRYALASFTEAEFNTKTLLVQNWVPQERYKLETKLITGLTPGVTYYFALRATNDTRDTSKMSNVASCWAQSVPTQITYAKIYGYIKNKQGQPVGGTLVDLIYSTTVVQQYVSLPSGYYEFLLYPLNNYIGTYKLVCSSSVYEVTVATVTVTTTNPLIYKDITLYSLGTLIVKVKNYVSDEVVPNALVSISPKNLSGYTDASGEVTFQGLTAATYTITATKTGYFQQKTSLWVETDTTTYVSVYIVPVSNIYITVKDAYTNSPINQANCILEPGKVFSLTNSQGQTSYVGLSSGSYTLTVYKTGYSTETVNINLLIGENKNVSVNLIPLSFAGVLVSTITGTVKDIKNDPIDNVEVGLVREGMIISNTLTNNEGKFIFYGVSTGTYNLHFSKVGYVSYSTTVVISLPEVVSLSIFLEAEQQITGYKITGYVKDRDSFVGISSCVVKLLPLGVIVYTNTEGYFEFLGISAGEYKLIILKAGYKETAKDIKIVSNDVNLGNIELTPYKTLEVVMPEKKINIVTKENVKISFSISPNESLTLQNVEAKIVDMYGRVVRSGKEIVKIVDGQGVLEWDYKDTTGKKVSSGVYFYQIKISNKISTGKIVVIR
ncbi:MAG: carboxypeptidase regulatory-like domain-containing protein [Endomicrobia bacterium]|nr:carboxypeptidase regulatory-like domain-containing protein [Endomicrobiia bacterium]